MSAEQWSIIKYLSDRWQQYAGKLQFGLTIYNTIIISILAIQNIYILIGIAVFAVLLLVGSIVFVATIDRKIINPNEFRHTFNLYPDFVEMKQDIKTIIEKIDR